MPSLASADGEAALTSQISSNRPTALIANDGFAVVGSDLLSVYDRLEALEATAETLVRSRFANGIMPLPDDAIAELTDAFSQA